MKKLTTILAVLMFSVLSINLSATNNNVNEMVAKLVDNQTTLTSYFIAHNMHFRLNKCMATFLPEGIFTVFHEACLGEGTNKAGAKISFNIGNVKDKKATVSTIEKFGETFALLKTDVSYSIPEGGKLTFYEGETLLYEVKEQGDTRKLVGSFIYPVLNAGILGFDPKPVFPVLSISDKDAEISKGSLFASSGRPVAGSLLIREDAETGKKEIIDAFRMYTGKTDSHTGAITYTAHFYAPFKFKKQ